MQKTIALLALSFVIAIACPAGAVGPDSIIGRWTTPDKTAQFEIYGCGSLYCGKIAWLREPDYPPADKKMPGRPKVDGNNPDPALRSRTLSGLPFISGFRYEGDNSWRGMIYNPEDGRTYRCIFSTAGDNQLKVRGYIGIPLLGQTQTWTRVP
jgi:uncharacterized protein (DUF2147 family)